MAFVTAKTVPTVIDIAILAAKAYGTIVCQLVAGAALAAVGEYITASVGTFFTAGAAQTAAILIPVVMVAKPALHAVLVTCKRRDGKHAKHHHHGKQKAHPSFHS